MDLHRKISLWLIVIIPLFWITFAKAFLNGLSDKQPVSGPCESIAESRSQGVFVSKASISKNPIQWDGQEIEIKEIWFEKSSHVEFLWVWLPFRKDMGSYQACLTLKRGHDIFRSSGRLGWIAEGYEFGGGLCSVNGAELFFVTMKELPSEFYLSLVDGENRERKETIKVTPIP